VEKCSDKCVEEEIDYMNIKERDEVLIPKNLQRETNTGEKHLIAISARIIS